jgi:small subunit ribosomal protein S21
MAGEWIKPERVEYAGTTVALKDGESPESLFKRFKKKVQKAGIEKEIYQRSFFEKPSVRKRRKHMENIRRMKREQAKLDKYLKKRKGTKHDEDEGDKR